MVLTFQFEEVEESVLTVKPVRQYLSEKFPSDPPNHLRYRAVPLLQIDRLSHRGLYRTVSAGEEYIRLVKDELGCEPPSDGTPRLS